MIEQKAGPTPRQIYDAALERALAFAERHLARDQALEIAHQVATEMLDIPAERVTASLIYVAVTRRLRDFWRSRERRNSAESAYHQVWSSTDRSWVEPGAQIELRELQERIELSLADMPAGMREVFLLIREEQLSYKEAAARLGISVKTVHSQICRAGVLLRRCVAQYRADAPQEKPSRKAKSP